MSSVVFLERVYTTVNFSTRTTLASTAFFLSIFSFISKLSFIAHSNRWMKIMPILKNKIFLFISGMKPVIPVCEADGVTKTIRSIFNKIYDAH